MIYAQINEFKITVSNGADGEKFGRSVSISGDYAIMGALYYDGAVYIFYRVGTTWTEQAKLLANDMEASDFFGFSVAISGDYAIEGAWFDDDNGSSSGSAYIFHRSDASWSQQTKITARADQ